MIQWQWILESYDSTLFSIDTIKDTMLEEIPIQLQYLRDHMCVAENNNANNNNSIDINGDDKNNDLEIKSEESPVEQSQKFSAVALSHWYWPIPPFSNCNCTVTTSNSSLKCMTKTESTSINRQLSSSSSSTTTTTSSTVPTTTTLSTSSPCICQIHVVEEWNPNDGVVYRLLRCPKSLFDSIPSSITNNNTTPTSSTSINSLLEESLIAAKIIATTNESHQFMGKSYVNWKIVQDIFPITSEAVAESTPQQSSTTEVISLESDTDDLDVSIITEESYQQNNHRNNSLKNNNQTNLKNQNTNSSNVSQLQDNNVNVSNNINNSIKDQIKKYAYVDDSDDDFITSKSGGQKKDRIIYANTINTNNNNTNSSNISHNSTSNSNKRKGEK